MRCLKMIDQKPILTKGKIVTVNDTAIKVDIQGRLGVICVPLRWVFTEKKLEPGQTVEFYFSYMQVI
jgi:hypothetical protein